MVKNEQRKLLTNISWNIFVELHDGGADHQELEQQVSAHPRLWIRRDRGLVSFEYEGMRLNVRLTILELLEQGRDHGLISFQYEGMRLNVCLIILELLEQYCAG